MPDPIVTAVIAAGVALLVAGVGAIVNWRLGSRQLTQELTLFRAQRTHSWNLAHAERRYQRRADAYAEVLTLLHNSMDWIERTEPFVGPTAEPPNRPDEEVIRRARALVDLFGSDATQADMAKLADRQRDFELNVRARQEARERHSDPEDGETGSFRVIHEARQDCRALRNVVVVRMRQDLEQRG